MTLLRQSSDQVLANFLPDAVIIIKKNGEIVWWNSAANMIFNIDTLHSKFKTITDLVSAPQLDTMILQPSDQQIEYDLATHRIALSIRPYLDNHLLVVAQDITPIHRLEKMRQDFLANVSHELRTPLTVVHGYLETLLEQAAPPPSSWQTILAQMYQQTLRMENLVNDLLLLSRLEVDFPEEREYHLIPVSSMLNSICNEAKVLSGEQKHQFFLQADDNLSIYGFDNELRSAFSNIIFNAVKYTPSKGKIDIIWEEKNNKANLIVRDTGIGIEEKHIPRLTERFYRVDKARSRTSGGTGLGLAIVKHVLIRHKAELKIESKCGVGSTFICIFPKSLNK